MSLTIILRKVGGVLTGCFRRGMQRVRAAALSIDVSRPGWSFLAVVLVLAFALLMARRGLRDFALAMMHGMMLSGAPPPPPAPSHFAEDGATTPIYAMATYPPGIYIASTNQTWVAYECWDGENRVLTVAVYDHDTGQWATNVRALWHPLTNDSHGNGALIRDADGYIHLIGGGHDSDQFHYVTESPDDPSQWWLRHTFSGDFSYPHPVLIGSVIHLFMRENIGGTTRQLVHYKTTGISSGVPTWGSETAIINWGADSRVYMTNPVLVGTDIHFTACLANNLDTVRRNGYYFVYDSVAHDVHNVDDSVTIATGDLPVDRTESDADFRFLSQTTDQSNLPSLCFDTNGDPHVAIMAGAGATSPAPEGTYDILHYTHDGASWSSPTTVVSGATMYRSAEIALVPLPSAEVALYYEDDPGDAYDLGGTAMKRAVRASGGSWGSATTLLTDSGFALARVTAIRAAHANARVAFTEVTTSDLDSATGIGTLKAYLHGDAGFVTRPTITTQALTINKAATARVGTFLVSTYAAGTRIRVKGMGIQPKALRLWSSGAGTISLTNGASRASEGFAISESEQVCAATLMNDATDPTDDHTHHRTDCCYMVLGNDGVSAGRLKLLEMQADGALFEITEQFTGDRLVTFQAYNSAVVTNAKILTIQEAGATGNQAYTGAGFQADFAAFIGVPDTTAAPNIAANSTWSIGVATSAASWVFAGGGQENVATANTMRYAKSAECVAFYNAGVTALDGRASLTSFDSDGLTLNWIARASTRRVYVLLLKGGSYKVGNFLSSTTLNATIAVSSFGFTPLGVAVMADRTSEDAAGTAEAQSYFWCHGAGTSVTNRYGHTVGSTDAAAVEDSMRGHTQSGMIYGCTVTAVQDSIVDLQTLDADGVTFKQTDPAASQYFVGYEAWA